MTALTERTKSLISDARRNAEPSSEDLQRVRARLAERIANESPDTVVVPFGLVKAGALLAALAIGASGAWYFATTRPVERVEPPAPPPVSVAAVAPSCPPVPECPPSVVVQAPAAPPKPMVCPPAALKGGANDSSRQALRNLEYSLPAEAADRWALEMGLLIDARVAVDEDRPLDALGHVQRHEKLFPQSAFQEERLALEIVATCQAGRPELVHASFAKLLELDAASTYLPRIRATCGPEVEAGETHE